MASKLEMKANCSIMLDGTQKTLASLNKPLKSRIIYRPLAARLK